MSQQPRIANDAQRTERRPSRPEEIARALRAEIASGALGAGERLPSEHALSRRFGASRATVREAVSRLKHDGLVESRRGSGAYVADAGQGYSFRIEPLPTADRTDLVQIFELRMAFETAAAAAAALRRNARHLARMRGALAAMARAIDERTDAVGADTAFHALIAEATGNAYFKRLVEFLEARLRGSIEASRSELHRDEERARAVQREHVAIYQAIADADAERARAAMLLHLSNAAEELGLSLSSIATRRAPGRSWPATKNLSDNCGFA